jgi:hypothetical protein
MGKPQVTILVFRWKRNQAGVYDVPSTFSVWTGFSYPGTRCKQSPFRLRDGELGESTVQADHELWEYPDAGLVQIAKAGGVNDHLGCEFCLFFGPT